MLYEDLFPRASDCVPLSEADAAVFVRVARDVSSYGFDWWFADKTACWGRRELGRTRADIRLGRLILHNGGACVTVRIVGNGREALWKDHRPLLESIFTHMDDARVFIPIERFELLLNTKDAAATEFIQSLYALAPPRDPIGFMEQDFDKSLTAGRFSGRFDVQAKRPVAIGCAPGFSELRMAYVRVGHQAFRRNVLKHWEGQCAVLGAIDSRLLIASHIVPWSDATDDEKTDFNNGLLLSAPLDALFDRGLISFDDRGTLLVGRLDSKTLKACGLSGKEVGLREPGRTLTEAMKGYLARHRHTYKFAS